MVHLKGIAVRLPSRRSVLAAGAWAVPAVSLTAAAPAFAVSGVGDFTMLLPQAGAARDTRYRGVHGYVPGGAGENVSMTITRGAGSFDLAAEDDRTYDVVANTVLGSGPAVVLHQQAWPIGRSEPTDAVYRQDATVHTIAFSAPVRNLSFTVGGLVTVQQEEGAGSVRDAMSDGVDVEPAPSSETPGADVSEVADGVRFGEPVPGFWYGTSTIATPDSHVRYTFEGPITQVTLRHIAYSRSPGGTGIVVQRITLSDITFDVTLPRV